MRNWAKQLAGAILVLVFALAVGGFVMLLRAQQGGLAATMAAAHIRAVSPPDGATNIPLSGEIRADYVSRPAHDPTITLEPPVEVTLDNPHWDATTFVIDYHGLRDNSLYHVELDQDDWTGKGEHKQIKVRWSFRTGTAPHVAPSPSPTSATPSISPAPSVIPTTGPLIWYDGPSNDLHGVDWTGKQVKNLSLDNVIQAPDGLLLWNRTIIPGGTTAVDDSDGESVGSVPVDPIMLWADDGRTFCGVRTTSTGSYDLDLLRINGPRVRVGAISFTPGTTQAPVPAACSVLTQRAVVFGRSPAGYLTSVSMISLTDGRLLYQQSYPNPPARIVASHDGQYIAEQFGSNTNGGPATLIRQLPSGTTVGQFSGVAVQGFSWDGSLVVGNTSGDPTVQEAQVYRWRTHEVVWHQCMCPHPHWLIVLPQPGGTKVAVLASTDDGTYVSFNIVDANGTSRAVPIDKTPITPAF